MSNADIELRLAKIENAFLNLSQVVAEQRYGAETVAAAEQSLPDMMVADPELRAKAFEERSPWNFICERYIERRNSLS